MSGDSLAKLKRFSEVDVVRGLLVLAMVMYHVVFDLDFFTDVVAFNNLIGTPVFNFLQIAIGGGFLFVAGVSLALSFQAGKRATAFFKRSFIILAAAMLITVVTNIIDTKYTVYFGILHLIAVASWLSYGWLKWYRPKILAVDITLVFILGIWLNSQAVDSWWGVIIGLKPTYFPTLDYYPLLPWLGFVWLGILCTRSYYLPRRDTWHILKASFWHNRFLVFIGRHALTIYLVHQPVILVCLMLL